MPISIGPNAYPYDPTGVAASNLVVAETHTITPTNGPNFSCVVPSFGPFFLTGLVINYTNALSVTVPLQNGIDYIGAFQFIGASRAIQTPVYGAITILNTTISGTLTIQYQTLGGQYTPTITQLTAISANVVYNAPTTSWEQIMGLPDVFPPSPHPWSLQDMVGMSNVVNSINTVATNVAAANAANAPINLTAAQIGLGNVPNYTVASTLEAIAGAPANRFMTPTTTSAAIQAALAAYVLNGGAINTAIANYLIAHPITAASVGLSNVQNLPSVTTPQVVANVPVTGDAFLTWNEFLIYIANHGGSPTVAAHGQLLSTYCNGFTQMGVYADGFGGSYTGTIATNSPSCGFSQPGSGSLLGTYCNGVNLMGNYSDGVGGSYNQLIAANSPSCGYSGAIITSTVNVQAPTAAVSEGAYGTVTYTLAGFTPNTNFTLAVTARAPGSTGNTPWPVTGTPNIQSISTNSNGEATVNATIYNDNTVISGTWTFGCTIKTTAGLSVNSTVNSASVVMLGNAATSPTMSVSASTLNVAPNGSVSITYNMSGFLPSTNYTCLLVGTPQGLAARPFTASGASNFPFTTDANGSSINTVVLVSNSTFVPGAWAFSGSFIDMTATVVSATVGSVNVFLQVPTAVVSATPASIGIGSTSVVTYSLSGFSPGVTYNCNVKVIPPGSSTAVAYNGSTNNAVVQTFTASPTGVASFSLNVNNTGNMQAGSWTFTGDFVTQASAAVPTTVTPANVVMASNPSIVLNASGTAVGPTTPITYTVSVADYTALTNYSVVLTATNVANPSLSQQIGSGSITTGANGAGTVSIVVSNTWNLSGSWNVKAVSNNRSSNTSVTSFSSPNISLAISPLTWYNGQPATSTATITNLQPNTAYVVNWTGVWSANGQTFNLTNTNFTTNASGAATVAINSIGDSSKPGPWQMKASINVSGTVINSNVVTVNVAGLPAINLVVTPTTYYTNTSGTYVAYVTNFSPNTAYTLQHTGTWSATGGTYDYFQIPFTTDATGAATVSSNAAGDATILGTWQMRCSANGVVSNTVAVIYKDFASGGGSSGGGGSFG